MTTYNYIDIRKLTKEHINHNVCTEGRIYQIRSTKTMCFIILRYQTHTLQTIIEKKNVGEEEFKKLTQYLPETIIRIFGTLMPFKVKSTTYKEFELHVKKYAIVSKSHKLPFSILDANENKNSFRSNVGNSLKLNNRYLDLRTPLNNSIFKVQSYISYFYRKYLRKRNFTEIHSPKILKTASESGAEVFKVDYFKKRIVNNKQIGYQDNYASLAQSPQFYKQLAINSDLDRVYEIGPVFRAEQSFTNRHLCEFTGMDLEMALTPGKDYYEIMHFIWDLLSFIFINIECKETRFVHEKTLSQRPEISATPLILTYQEGVKMLREANVKIGDFEDLSRKNEFKLGQLVKEKYKSDLFILCEYPWDVRPFYTKKHQTKKGYTYSFDIIFRGQEISTGGQREEDYNSLLANMEEKKIEDPENLRSYTNSFRYGSKPHGGCGIGLERLTMLYLGLDNIRRTSLFPRDPIRLEP